MTAIAYDPNAVINPDQRIAEVLLGLMGWAHATYVYPSHRKILQLLREFTGRAMSERTLNRHLKALERDGHIRRKRRLADRGADEPHALTTLYFPRGRYLARAQRLARALMGWAKAKTQRDSGNQVGARSPTPRAAPWRLLVPLPPKMPDPADNQQHQTAIDSLAPVDKPPDTPK